MSSDLVLVTGASGYIATHVVKQLQQQDHRVRGTVRSLKNEEKVKPLKELSPDAKYPLELVEADLLDANSWKNAVNGCTFVIHVASPLPPGNPEDENDVIRPAVDGTLNVLQACKEAKTVKRVVITSSFGAITVGMSKRQKTFTEKDWTDVTRKSIPAYYKSKTLAEKAAWDFMNDLPDDEKFELSVVHPSYVIGPVLCGPIVTSMIYPKMILEDGEAPFLRNFNLPIVDVRDVAIAHIKAMILPEAAGNRHILSAGHMCFEEIANIIAEEFNPQGFNVKVKEIPSFVIGPKADNHRMISVLGIQPRNIKDSIIDMCYSMIEKGKVNTRYTHPKSNI